MEHTSLIIRNKAKELGFDACGFAHIEPLSDDAHRLREWLEKGNAGNMNYMHTHENKRSNPTLLMEQAQSIIVVLMNYYPPKKQHPEDPQIAYYAYGNDYHYIIKQRLTQLIHSIKQLHPDSYNIAYCDTAPILERAWAAQAGLGWIGKSGMLINPEIGSYTLIGCIITSIHLPAATATITPHCGNCTACIDACPTDAILDNHTIDARRCISYNTIENREQTNPELEAKFGNHLYGCDKCLKACPWNKKAKPHNIEELKPLDGLLEMNWSTFTRSTFKHLFKHSAMQRAGYQKLRTRLEKIHNL